MAKTSRPSAILLLICVLLLAGGILLFQSLRQKRAASSAAHEATPSTRQATAAKAAASTTAAPAAAPVPSHPPGVNAADIYKNAFELFNELTDEEKNMLANPRDEVDADKAAALFEKIQPIMELLRTAKDAAYCDWGISKIDWDHLHSSDGFPQLNVAKNLGHVALWSAAYRFSSAPMESISDLAIEMRLGHSVGDETVEGFFTQTEFERDALGLINSNSESLTPEASAAALNLIRNSKVEKDYAGAMESTSELFAALADDPKARKARDEICDTMTDFKKLTKEEANAQIPADMRFMAQVLKEYAAKSMLSDADFSQWCNQLASNPRLGILPKEMFVNPHEFGKPRTELRNSSVNRAMLTAGLTALQSGSGALASQPDPTTGQPFTCVPTPDGFELRSTFQYKNKPVTMKFATPAPKPLPNP